MALEKLSDYVKAEMKRSLNGRWSKDLNPDGIRYSIVGNTVGEVKWRDVTEDYDIDVDVMIIVRPKTEVEEKRPRRRAVKAV